MSIAEDLLIERNGPVLAITFNRPAKKNALTGAMYLAAAEALRAANADPSIGAIIFSGTGGTFTAGNDLADFLELSEDADELPALFFVKALAQCETPLIAAIEGVAVGIGATMVLHFDLVYLAPNASFRMPFVDLGLVPEAACSLLLPRRIGLAKASEFLLLGESFGAEEALRLGLANEIIAAAELQCHAMAQAQKIAAKPRAAALATRRLLRGDKAAILERIEEEGCAFLQALRSEEARGAFRSFLGKTRK